MIVGQHGLIGVVALDALVAQLAVGEAQLAVVEDLAGALHEFLLGEDPARRGREERAPAAVGREARGAVAADIALNVVFRLVVVHQAAEIGAAGQFVDVLRVGRDAVGVAGVQVGDQRVGVRRVLGHDRTLLIPVVLVTDHGAEVVVLAEGVPVVGIDLRGVGEGVAAVLFEFRGQGAADVFRTGEALLLIAEIGGLALEVLDLGVGELGREDTRDGQSLDGGDVQLELGVGQVLVALLLAGRHQGCIGVHAVFARGIAAVAPFGLIDGRDVAHAIRRR